MTFRSGELELTARESLVLKFIVEGRTYRLIAQELAISPNAVHRYAAHFFNAYGCHSREELAEMWQQAKRDAENRAA